MLTSPMDTGSFGYGDLFDHSRQIELDKGEILHRSEENCRAFGMVLTGEQYPGWLTASEP